MATQEEVIKVTGAYAAKVLQDEQQITVAVSLAWYHWSQSKRQDLPASVFARFAIRQVRSGRDLPGCGTGSKDALHRMTQGAGMDQMADRRPGPDKLAQDREELLLWLPKLTESEMQTALALLSGLSPSEVADAYGWTRSYVSQLRRSAATKWYE